MHAGMIMRLRKPGTTPCEVCNIRRQLHHIIRNDHNDTGDAELF